MSKSTGQDTQNCTVSSTSLSHHLATDMYTMIQKTGPADSTAYETDHTPRLETDHRTTTHSCVKHTASRIHSCVSCFRLPFP